MKTVFLVVVAACGAATAPPPAAAPPAAAQPTTAQITETRTFENGAMHLRIDGSDVPLAQTPIADWVGLPMLGTGSIHVDLRIPVVGGASDLRGADGDIAIDCARCQLGDDVAKLDLGRRSAFTGDGIEVGHVALDAVAIAVTVRHGQADITRWTVTSPDLDVVVSGRVALGRSWGDSAIEACVRFIGKPALRDRNPRGYAALETTGATLAGDGKLDIRLAGSIGKLRLLAQVCDGSQPLAAVPPDVEPHASPPPPPVGPDATAGSDDLTALLTQIKKVDDHTYAIDRDVVVRLLDNPMALARSARIVPTVKDGKPAGFKLYAIRPDSLFAHLGLQNGDTLVSVNGFELTSADQALAAYTKLRDATSIEVELVRRGAPLTLTYAIR